MSFFKNLNLFYLIALTFTNVILINGENFADLEEVFKLHEIIPDVISQAPKEFLQVTYHNGLHADRGMELTPTQVQAQPQIEWNADPNSFYTLILTDPDAPSRTEPRFREFRHWLVGNIPGMAVENGEVLTAYIGSGPPLGSGLHRYVYLVYKQPGKILFDEPRISNRSRATRPNFRAAQFAEKYQLGAPIAGNFYQAQWDEYVPILNQQLSEDN